MSNELAETTENLPANNATSIMAVIERAALNPDVDIDKMERLLQMQERIMEKQAEIEFNQSMVACQSEMPSIYKDAMNNQTSSRYSRIETINKQITPIYVSQGFSLSFGTDTPPAEGWVRTVCDVAHSGGHTKRFYYDSPLDDVGIKGTKNKTGVHAIASSMSYNRRYLTMMIFNLVLSDDDDDGNAAGTQTITEQQAADLQALIDDIGADKVNFLKFLKVERMEDLPAHSYKGAVNALEAKRS